MSGEGKLGEAAELEVGFGVLSLDGRQQSHECRTGVTWYDGTRSGVRKR